MGPNGTHLLGLDVALGEQRLNHLGIQAAQGIGRQGTAVQLVWARLVQGQQLGTQWCVKRGVLVGQDLNLAVGKVNQYPIHPVQRSAGHEADEQLGHALLDVGWRQAGGSRNVFLRLRSMLAKLGQSRF